MAVWLQVKVRGHGPMAYSLYACSVCDTKAPLQLQLWLVALCMCYMPLPLLSLLLFPRGLHLVPCNMYIVRCLRLCFVAGALE